MKSPLFEPHYSLKNLLRASVLLPFLWAPDSFAVDSYTVENVIVDAGGKDATDARAKALDAGEKDAFAQLILRLNPKGATQVLAQVSHVQVGASVTGFSVAEEKMTADHYHATLNYHFNPKQIQAIMPGIALAAPTAAAVIPVPPVSTAAATPVLPAPATPAPAPAPAVAPPAPAPAPAPPPSAPAPTSKAVLVLPVYGDASNQLLWQEENKWRDVWYEAALEAGGGLVVVPLGDMNDRVDVDDSNVNAATADSLKRMYGRYGVGKIMEISAVYDEKADPKPTLQVSLKPIGPGAPVQMSYIIHTSETPDALLARAAADVAGTLLKQQTSDPGKVETDRVKEINARVNTTSIKDWEALRKRLLMHSNIVSIRFVSISYYETSMVILYRGQSDMLGKTLVASGLRVLQDGNSLVLSLP